jgi:hypothetical protein
MNLLDGLRKGDGPPQPLHKIKQRLLEIRTNRHSLSGAGAACRNTIVGGNGAGSERTKVDGQIS